ncbi:bifunctional DNA primase/polymerase [Actinophytocola sp.]|uniref:bifunctional DNA primase/polymerase n=1 Tax=Actinophytocola sp. TaxID=1872138 RepID=UPI00389AF3F5
MAEVDSRFLLRVALHTAEQGMFVFPLWPRTKVPALHGADQCSGLGVCAHGHQGWEARATRDPELIRRWWRNWPLNIGVAAGRSGLHVLDLDSAHDAMPPREWAGARDGWDVLARVAGRAGQPFPGDTYAVRTPSGGFHLYFGAPPLVELRNTVARLGWRVDSRGSGGYVVAAGSLRPQGRYDLVADRPIAALPAWLVPLLLPPPFLEPPVDQAPTGWYQAGAVSEVRKNAYLQTIHDKVAATPSGERHHVLIRAAYTLGRLVGGGDLDAQEARDCLHAAASRWRGRLSRKDIRTIEDGLRAGAERGRSLAS